MAFDTTHDIVPDSPTNTFATLNPLFNGYGTSVFSNGNLYVAGDSSNWTDSVANFYVSSGKWYWEILPYDQYIAPGIADIAFVSGSSGHTGSNQITLYGSDGNYGGDVSGSAASFNSTNIIGFLLDMDSATRTLKYYKDNSLIGTVNLPTGYTQVAPIMHLSGSATTYTKLNFGADSSFGGAKSGSANATDANGIGDFYYSVPSGAKALSTANIQSDLAIDPAVNDVPEDYMRPVVISGTNADNNNVFVGFQPDLCWLKNRNGASGHMIVDSVRGAGYALQSDNGGQEGTYNIANDFKEFTSTGFNLGAVSAYGSSNPSGTNNIISWCWKAGGAPDLTSSPTKPFAKDNVQYETLSAANITAGTITPTAMSIGTKQGFSIVKFNSGSAGNVTIPHGLNAKPDFVFLKALESSASWYTFHNGLSDDTKYLYLNSTFSESGLTQNTRIWGGRTFDSNVISAETGYTLNANENYIAYCFTSIPGYSAFGSYTGNNSTDGPMIHLGFSPALVICKLYTGTSNSSYHSWLIYDNARQTSNPNHSPLFANKSVQEGYRGDGTTSSGGELIYLDFLSTGFKIRSNGTELNGNGGANDKFIYMAWAEMPQKYSVAR